MEFVLLLTGCIRPNCDDILHLKDCAERERQYVDAINWYIANTDSKIIFCENSGTDISNRFEASDRLEFLTFQSGEGGVTPNNSKSYKEMEIVEYASMHANFFQLDAVFVKITGRLKYLNIMSAQHYLRKKIKNTSAEYVCCDLGKTNIWSDSRFFFFTKPFLSRLLSKKEQVSLEFEFERALGTCVFQGLSEHLRFIYPNEPQRVSGIGGGFGCTYDETDEEFRKRCRRHQLWKCLFDTNLLPRFKAEHIERYGSK